MHTISTGLSSGSVMFRKTCHGPAPSMRAASWGSSGSDCSAARISTVNHGVHSQTSVITTMAKLVQR